jgi:hypothetical protein
MVWELKKLDVTFWLCYLFAVFISSKMGIVIIPASYDTIPTSHHCIKCLGSGRVFFSLFFYQFCATLLAKATRRTYNF